MVPDRVERAYAAVMELAVDYVRIMLGAGLMTPEEAHDALVPLFRAFEDCGLKFRPRPSEEGTHEVVED